MIQTTFLAACCILNRRAVLLELQSGTGLEWTSDTISIHSNGGFVSGLAKAFEGGFGDQAILLANANCT